MKTLDDVLVMGTPSEQVLARLCQDHAVDLNVYLQQHWKEHLFPLPFITAIGGVSLYGCITEPSTGLLTGPLVLAAGVMVTGSVGALRKNRIAQRAQQEWQQHKEPHFYRLDGSYVLNTSPVAEVLGERVYPVDTSEQVQSLPPYCLIFLGGMVTSAQLQREEYWQDVGCEYPAKAHATRWVGTLLAQRGDEVFSIGVQVHTSQEAARLEHLASDQSYSLLTMKQGTALQSVVALYDALGQEVKI